MYQALTIKKKPFFASFFFGITPLGVVPLNQFVEMNFSLINFPPPLHQKPVHKATSGERKLEKGRAGATAHSHLKVITLLIRCLIKLFLFSPSPLSCPGGSQYLLNDAFKDLRGGSGAIKAGSLLLQLGTNVGGGTTPIDNRSNNLSSEASVELGGRKLGRCRCGGLTHWALVGSHRSASRRISSRFCLLSSRRRSKSISSMTATWGDDITRVTQCQEGKWTKNHKCWVSSQTNGLFISF